MRSRLKWTTTKTLFYFQAHAWIECSVENYTNQIDPERSTKTLKLWSYKYSHVLWTEKKYSLSQEITIYNPLRMAQGSGNFQLWRKDRAYQELLSTWLRYYICPSLLYDTIYLVRIFPDFYKNRLNSAALIWSCTKNTRTTSQGFCRGENVWSNSIV